MANIYKKASWFDKNVIMGLSLRKELYNALKLEYAAGSSLRTGLEDFLQDQQGLFAGRRKTILNDFLINIDNGLSLNDAVGDYFPSDEKLFLEAIWPSPNKKDGFGLLAERCDRKTKNSLKSIIQFVPGLLILSISFGMYYFVGGIIHENLQSVKVPVNLTGKEEFAIWFSQQPIPIVVLFGCIPLSFIIILFWSLANWTGVGRKLVDNFGPWRAYKEAAGSAMLLNIAEMHRSNISFKDALYTLSKDASPYLKTILLTAYQAIIAGDKLGDALTRAGYIIPNISILRQLKRIENTKEFSHHLEELVTTHSEKVISETQAKLSVYAFSLMGLGLMSIVVAFPLIFSISKVAKAGLQNHLF